MVAQDNARIRSSTYSILDVTPNTAKRIKSYFEGCINQVCLLMRRLIMGWIILHLYSNFSSNAISINKSRYRLFLNKFSLIDFIKNISEI